jgi:hypothetical protein
VKNRPRKPKRVSLSTIRLIEKIAQQGRRAIRRQLNSAVRRKLLERSGGYAK